MTIKGVDDCKRKDMDVIAILSMMQSYLIEAKVSYGMKQLEAIKRIKSLCEELLK